MKHREYDIDLLQCSMTILQEEDTLHGCVRRKDRAYGTLSPGTILHCFDGIHFQPAALLCNTDDKNVIFTLVNLAKNCRHRNTGNLVFGRLTAKHDSNRFLIHNLPHLF